MSDSGSRPDTTRTLVRREPTGVVPESAARVVWRLRTVAVCVALTALAFLQEPGQVAMDTKVDLAVNPVGWIARSLHVWNPDGTFGQLQNQTYGYLWPMGPFFVAGDWLALPPWVVQRLWWAMLLCVGCTGVIALAGRLNIGTEATRIIAGVAFALSPRILTELGPISVEAWPTAVAPWVLVPLIGLARGAPIRRGVAGSAIAVACAGGVNATAVLAVVPLAMLWLLTLDPLRRRLTAVLAWCLAVAAATAWWLVPLLILGRFSPPFMDYIETAPVTTRVTDLVSVLRGANHWLAYGRTWDAGAQLATEPILIIGTLLVAALGLAGLARNGMPHRRFLVTGLLAGVAMVGFGHVAAVDGILAEAQRAFLDGAGSPLRNVHKFDVVLRLPLILGLAHLLGVLARRATIAGPGWHHARQRATVTISAALAGIAVVASPALAGGLPPAGSFDSVPGYWRAAGSWLDARLGPDRVLVAPAARFPNYQWGSPADEITQPLLRTSWAVRNSIPLTPPTTIRLLDAIESALATGAGSPGLADLLARSGVRYLLLRSDLDYGSSRAVRPMIVRQALARSPGLHPVAGFGPTVGGGEGLGNYPDQGLDVPVQALEVYEVVRPVAPVATYDASAVTTVVGGPESLLDLAAAGQLGSAPTMLAGDLTAAQGTGTEPTDVVAAAQPAGAGAARGEPPAREPTPDGAAAGGLPADLLGGPVALTDGLRRREVTFGLSHDNSSATMEPDEPWLNDGVQHDYLPAWGDEQTTAVRYHGVRGVTASNSWSQAHPLSGSRAAHHPFAAIDGDPDTSWRTSPGAGDRQWLEVELESPRRIDQVRIRFDTDADMLPTKVTVSSGPEWVTVDSFGGEIVVPLSGVHATARLRVIVEEALPMRTGQGRFGIAELEIPGVRAERTLVVPPAPANGEPGPVVLTAAPTTPSCFFLDGGAPRCATGVTRASEDADRIDRTVTLPAATGYRPVLWVRPRPGPELNALLDAEVAKSRPLGLAPRVITSSTRFPDPVARPGAVLDGDPATAWWPTSEDPGPWLKLNWLTPRTITGLRLATADGVAGARAWQITVIGDGGIRSGVVGQDGMVTFDQPLRTDEITVLFRHSTRARSFDPYQRDTETLPLGLGEIATLPDGPEARNDLTERVLLPCGSGPEVRANGRTLATRVTASRRDLLELREVPAEVCPDEESTGSGGSDPLALPAGESRIVVAGTDLVTPTRIALLAGSPPTSTPSGLRIDQWSATERRLRVWSHPVDRVIVVRENHNPGWQATVGGRALVPITLDGWQQGWILPAGLAGAVTLRFTPDRPYRLGLAAGAVSLGLVLLLAVLPRRRPVGSPADSASDDLPAASDPPTASADGARLSDDPPRVSVGRVRPGRRDWRWVLTGGVGAVALLVVGGLSALAFAVIATLALLAVRVFARYLDETDRRRLAQLARMLTWLTPVVGFAMAGWLYLGHADRHEAALPQLAALAAATALLFSVVVPARDLTSKLPHRNRGRSKP